MKMSLQTIPSHSRPHPPLPVPKFTHVHQCIGPRNVTTPMSQPLGRRSHTHPLHSQTSRLLTSSLFLGFPVHRTTQCMRVV